MFCFVLLGQFHDAMNRSASAPNDLSAGWDESVRCFFSPPRNSRMWLLQYSYLNYCNVPTFSGCLLSITLCASKIYFVYFGFNTQNEHFFNLQKDKCCISLTTAENYHQEFW